MGMIGLAIQRSLQYAVAALAILGVSAAIANDITDIVHDPSAPHKAKYETLRNVVNGELDALGQDYARRLEELSEVIDARRLSQLENVTDVFERNQIERALSQLKQRSISELQRELGDKRKTLNNLMRESSSALSRDGVIDTVAWQSIAGFSAENPLGLPDEILALAGPGSEVEERAQYTGFAAAINSCTVYEEEFEHPFTGEMLLRRVTGSSGESCRVEEEVPGDMLMACNYSLDRLPAVAGFYAHPEKFDNAKVSSSTRFVEGEAVTTTSYTIDGEEISHPINEALASGECAVTPANDVSTSP
ncbi:MAG: hypothetical protein QNJ11_18140 [Woeseiaceae bacterium]|nr:hypothetical protein [Woeseiaceae bacterium]